jgi:hypothetical protein
MYCPCFVVLTHSVIVGPANYCPVLVGAILGSFFGYDSINVKHFRHVEKPLFDRVFNASKALATGWKEKEDEED